jgi:hypothetical protein
MVGIERAWKHVYIVEGGGRSLSDSNSEAEHRLSFVRVILTNIFVNIFIVSLAGNVAKSKRVFDMM